MINERICTFYTLRSTLTLSIRICSNNVISTHIIYTQSYESTPPFSVSTAAENVLKYNPLEARRGNVWDVFNG